MAPESATADILPFKRPQRSRPTPTRTDSGAFGHPARPVPDALYRGQRHEPVTAPPELVLLDNDDDTDKLIDGILTTIRDAMDARGLQDHTDDILDAVAEHIANQYFGYTTPGA